MPYLFSSNIEPGAVVSQHYTIPYRGVNKVLPVHQIPPDALFDGHNVVIRFAELRSRAGLYSNASEPVEGIPLAAIQYIGKDGTKYPIMLTTTNLWRYIAAVQLWERIGTLPLAIRDTSANITMIEANDQINLIVTDGMHPLYWWNLTTPFSQIPQNGEVATPILRDVAVAANRVIGIQLPYTVRWSQILAPDQWRDSNVAILADTEDEVVAIRPLGTLGFVVYKTGSIWVGFLNAGSDANAFRFEHFGLYEGPANPQAIIHVSGVDIYMTPSGRIGSFDGSQQVWLCDGLWPFIAQELDPLYVTRIRASYSYLHNEVTFYYPALGDHGDCHNIVTINLPYREQGIETVAAFSGSTHLDVAACLSIRLFIGDRNPWVFTAEGKSFRSSGEAYMDDQTPFLCSMQPGLHALPQTSIIKPSFELYALRDESRGMIEVFEVHSGLLSEPGGIVEDKGLSLDLTRRVPNQYFGMMVSDTFIGFKVEWLSDARFHYFGANFYARALVP